MRTFLATTSLLVLGLWLGALVLFGAILAPLAAGIHAAGTVVGGTLVRLHWMGLICGIVFLLFTLVLSRFAHWHSYTPQAILVLVMLVLTAYSQFSIIPEMNTARDAVGGEITAVAENNPGRQIFDRLHNLSTRIEGIVLVCGLVAFMLGGRPQKPKFIL